MIGLVKKRLNYDIWENDDPTALDNVANGFELNLTWLNILTGSSFNHVSDGVWQEIDRGLNNKASIQFSKSLRTALIGICNNDIRFIPYYVQRRNLWNIEVAIPENLFWRIKNFDRIWALGHIYSCISWACDEASFVISGNNTEIQKSGEFESGPLQDFSNGYVLIQGTKFNDGVYKVISNNSLVLTVEGNLTECEDEVLISFMQLPKELLDDVGAMAWFDLFIRNGMTGLKSESIGTYSYTKDDTNNIGGMSYPRDLVPFISTQKQITMVS